MADAVLDFLSQFSKALVITFWDEDRVVAEPFRTVFLSSDAAVYDTLEAVYLLDAGAAARTYVLLLNQADDSAETSLSVLLAI